MGQGAIKGFNDIFAASPEPCFKSGLWQFMLQTSAEVMASYGYSPAWFPCVEYTELFARGLGGETDVVSKEMYSFTDRGNRSLSLRPEGTAGATRAYIDQHLSRNDPRQKWYYQGPMFRAERPQKGRYRQFYQLGAECYGASGPVADVEVLHLLTTLTNALGLPPTRLRINTLGDADSRAAYLRALSGFLAQHEQGLCGQCQARAHTNPLRTLDCKEPSCQALMRGAPDIMDSLTDASRRWYDRYETLLSRANIAYERSPSLVRGLDYYTEAIFELTTDALGAQDAIFGGGRYDGLVHLLGGPPTPAVGFAAGLERIALLIAQNETSAPHHGQPDLALLAADDESQADVLSLAEAIRHERPENFSRGPRVLMEADGIKLKHAMRRADRAKATYVVVIGERERLEQMVNVKHMGDGTCQRVAMNPRAIVEAMVQSAA